MCLRKEKNHKFFYKKTLYEFVLFYVTGPTLDLTIKKSKDVPRQAKVVLGVPGRLTILEPEFYI